MRHRLIELGNFYPRSPCGERPTQKKNQPDKPHISIHALLAESDSSRATETGKTPYFYPRSPCGERRGLPAIKCPKTTISIHALLAESDITIDGHTLPITSFLSTLSLRRATRVCIGNAIERDISIHALLAESDSGGCRVVIDRIFLSTLSLRRATFEPGHHIGGRIISIHALLAESDGCYTLHCSRRRIFLSTLSLRRATSPVVAVSSLTVYFYPRSPCGERQKLILQFLSLLRISIHALLAESDSIDNSEISDNLTFLSTLSLRRATLDFGRG